MKYLRLLPIICIAGLTLVTEVARAADEDVFLGQLLPQTEQTMGQGQSALWTLPLVATQYQPLQPAPAMQAALQAQQEGRFLDALILLEDAGKSGQAGADAEAEMNLLHASFLLQGNQSQQTLEILAPLLGNTQHAADAYALTAMVRLQQGQMREAREAANHALQAGDGMLSHLALSYALQGAGRLAEAREAMHGFNARTPQAITLAREAELALTLDQVQSAKALVNQAQGADATHPYVIAVSGLVYLIDGQAGPAKTAFATALQRNPKDAKALLGLGLAEIKLGDFQAGQKKLQAADEADPGNALILTYLGRSQQQSGQTEAAKASWHSAQQADPKDPAPWLYQAQAELQANRPLDARESLREVQARTAYRSVYRGEHLLMEDEQLLQANLAEIQRRLGMEGLAFQTLSTSSGASSAANLRNQADVLQGQRFGESARRSLLLQSQFDDKPGNLPSELDIYGDGAGQTGASTPQHGVVSGLSVQQASYNNYDGLFNRRTTLEADATTGSRSSNGEQIRLGVGNDTLGLGMAQRQFKTDGYAPFENLDNSIAQGIVQWLPTRSTQVFMSQQTFKSQHGETINSPDPVAKYQIAIEDNSRVTRLGMRHTLTDASELRGLWSHQRTDQPVDLGGGFLVLGSSSAHSEELQYRRTGASYDTQWGVQQTHGQTSYWYPSILYSFGYTQDSQQAYAAWQQTLNPYWQLDAGLGWGKIDDQGNKTSLARWLPKLGAIYTPDSGTHVRFAAWQGMDAHAVGDATLAPVSLAGMLLARPADNGKRVKTVALGGDRQLTPDWLLAAQTQRRKNDFPVIFPPDQTMIWQQVDESRLVMHWQPQGKPWTMSFTYDDESIRNAPTLLWPDSVDEQRLRSQQLALRWFASAHLTANLAWSHNRVAGTYRLTDPDLFTPTLLSAYRDGFNQVDADMSWQFNGARGLFTAGVRNAADTRFQYVDIDRLNPRFSNGRLWYAKVKNAW
jgi:tetratricopeptide (TPR) repeat protein